LGSADFHPNSTRLLCSCAIVVTALVSVHYDELYYVLMWETGEVQRPHPGLVDENGVAPLRTARKSLGARLPRLVLAPLHDVRSDVSAVADYRIRIFYSRSTKCRMLLRRSLLLLSPTLSIYSVSVCSRLGDVVPLLYDHQQIYLGFCHRFHHSLSLSRYGAHQ